MRLHSYVVARDYGFAPNPFYQFCTLATCKAEIRRTAEVGDWIVGTGSKEKGREGYLVFVMKVAEILTYDQYWNDPRFESKKPNLSGSKKQAFGDNIYHRNSLEEPWQQENSHHSLKDGQPNELNIKDDTKSTNVLIGIEYAYWGGAGPKIPQDLRDFNGYDLCKLGQGHKNHFPDVMVTRFLEWFKSLEVQGYLGMPLDWENTP
jgi:hypothetical protein